MALIKNAQADSLPRKAMVLDLGDLQRQAEVMARDAGARAGLIIEDAGKERQRIIAGAAEEGQKKGFDEGLAKGLAEGREKGQQEAMAQTKASVEAMVKAWTAALGQFEQQREHMMSTARVDVLRLAATIAERVTKRSVELDPEPVVAQMEAVLRLVMGPTNLRLRVHGEDAESAKRIAPTLVERFAPGSHAEVVVDETLQRGSCVVMTDKGELDASVASQVERIIAALMPGSSGAAASDAGVTS